MLTHLDLQALRAEWLKRYGPPPKLRSPELLKLFLAWRIQADAFGGLDAATRRRLRRDGGVGRSDHVSSGVRITREWQGRTYVIDRTDGGYELEGQTFASLSALARTITGTKRNGPAFFGLRDEEGRGS